MLCRTVDCDGFDGFTESGFFTARHARCCSSYPVSARGQLSCISMHWLDA